METIYKWQLFGTAPKDGSNTQQWNAHFSCYYSADIWQEGLVLYYIALLPIQGVLATQLMQATGVVHAKLPINNIQAVYKHTEAGYKCVSHCIGGCPEHRTATYRV
jgi:hypothetical protein